MPSALRPTRRRVLIAAAVLVVLVVAGILLFVGRSGPSGYGDVTPQPTDTGTPPPQVHPFGEAVRLRTSRTVIQVRPTDYSRQPGTAATGPAIGVELTVKNVGAEPYLDQPSQAASVVFKNGDEADRIYDPVGSCRGVSPDTVRMWPGEARRWCIAFERTSRPDVFVYAPEIGLPLAHGAPEQAAWRLGGRGRSAP